MLMQTRKALKSALLSALLVTAANVAFAEPETVLKYSSWFPESHSTNTVLRDWIKQVEAATDGRVTVEYLPKTVQGPREQFDVVVDGLADIVIVLPGYTPGRFPVLELGELPLLVATNEATLAPAFYKIYQEDIAATEPFKGVHVLTTWASAPTHIATKPGPITEMGQMQGLKIRAPSATAGMVIDAMGAVTVQKPVTEIYELASTGIVDGTFFSYGPMIYLSERHHRARRHGPVGHCGTDESGQIRQPVRGRSRGNHERVRREAGASLWRGVAER
jgi:TRAP-type transport system periplasmic protein